MRYRLVPYLTSISVTATATLPSLAALNIPRSRENIFTLPCLSFRYHQPQLHHQHRTRCSYTATTSVINRKMSSGNNNAKCDDQESIDLIMRSRKKALRKIIRSEMKKLSYEEIQSQSASVWKQLFSTNVYKNSKSVGCFVSMPSGEINSRPILSQILENKQLFVPRVGLDFELCDMDLVKVKKSQEQPNVQEDVGKESPSALFYDSWPRNKWGIPEPPLEDGNGNATPGDIDLLIVPGCAFDMNGGRLGQGKGYYDRFISRMQGQKKMILAGVCLKPQFITSENYTVSNKELDGDEVIKEIPMMPHDFPLDLIVTPDDIFLINKDLE